MRHSSLFYIGLGLLGILGIVAVAAPFLVSLGPLDLASQLRPPHAGFPLGHDEEGRDLFRLILYGSRVSLIVGFVTVSCQSLIGTLFGFFAGYRSGRLDEFFIFVTDLFLAFPSILLAIALAAFQREPGLWNIIFILTVVGWVSYARLTRGLVLSLKGRDFIQAARGIGVSPPRLFLRHFLPNLAPPLLVQVTFGMAGVILAEATLSFLGIGLPPSVPSWGRLLDQGVQYLMVAPHLSLFPGLAIMLTILALNFVGDGLRDRLDVKEGGKV